MVELRVATRGPEQPLGSFLLTGSRPLGSASSLKGRRPSSTSPPAILAHVKQGGSPDFNLDAIAPGPPERAQQGAEENGRNREVDAAEVRARATEAGVIPLLLDPSATQQCVLP